MRKLFLDWDGVIGNSIKAYCDVYNVLYSGYPDFKKADHTLVREYDLKDQCPLVEDVNAMFATEWFWFFIEFMPNAYDAIRELSKKFKTIICSIGTYENLSMKAKWISNNLPFIDDCILIKNHDCNMDKSIIDMSGGIIVDDVAHNLLTSNADIKVLFDNDFRWNDGHRNKFNFMTYDWNKLYNYLINIPM